jgi:methylphosphotriester-DNA--protein-cysteine methyltransferase
VNIILNCSCRQADDCGLDFACWSLQLAESVRFLPRLAAGEAVTSVALDLSYESIAAFTTMFKRTLGAPPSRYLREISLPVADG